jgi:hypothetical protein
MVNCVLRTIARSDSADNLFGPVFVSANTFSLSSLLPLLLLLSVERRMVVVPAAGTLSAVEEKPVRLLLLSVDGGPEEDENNTDAAFHVPVLTDCLEAAEVVELRSAEALLTAGAATAAAAIDLIATSSLAGTSAA